MRKQNVLNTEMLLGGPRAIGCTEFVVGHQSLSGEQASYKYSGTPVGVTVGSGVRTKEIDS